MVVDSGYAVWRVLGNSYWLALHAVGAQGRIRYHHDGEGAYEETERVLQALLEEAGAGAAGGDLVDVVGEGVEAPADWAHLRSPETYVGALRAERFSSPVGLVPDAPHGYAFPARLRAQHWALSGHWTVEDESAVLAGEPGRIAYRFSARDLHLAMGPVAGPARLRVLLDGRAPAAGTDVDDDGSGTADRWRLYQPVRQPGPVGEREFEVEFPDGGVAAQVFAFG